MAAARAVAAAVRAAVEKAAGEAVSSHLMGSLLGPTLAIQRMRKSAAITRRRKGLMSRDLAEESERMSLLGHAAAHGGAV